MLEETLQSPLDCKEIQPVHPKGNQSWIFIGRTDAEAETPILWPHNAYSWLIWNDPDAGKDWRQEEKGMTEDEMVGWHHQLNGHGFGWTPEFGDGQGGLACCSPCGRRVGHYLVTELNWWFCGSAALNMPANLENSTVATGLEKVSFSFQFQRKAMPKNAQTTTQLHSSHMLVK